MAKKKGRKLLSVTGAVVLTFGATSAFATGNLMPDPGPEPTPLKDKADAGTPAPGKKEAPPPKGDKKK